MFDPALAKLAIRNVRERSISPTTIHDLTNLLDSAVHAVGRAEGEVGSLRSALDGEREQIANATAYAESLRTKAQTEYEAAVSHERAVTDHLVGLLEDVCTQLTSLDQTITGLRSELVSEQQQAAAAREAFMAQLQQIQSARTAAEMRAKAFASTLKRIADMPWYRAVRHAAHVAQGEE